MPRSGSEGSIDLPPAEASRRRRDLPSHKVGPASVCPARETRMPNPCQRVHPVLLDSLTQFGIADHYPNLAEPPVVCYERLVLSCPLWPVVNEGFAMPLQQSIADFRLNPTSAALRSQLQHDLLPLAGDIVRIASKNKQRAFIGPNLTDKQIRELQDTYEGQPRVVADFVIENVISNSTFTYRDDNALKSYAGMALRIDIEGDFKEKQQYQPHYIPDQLPPQRPADISLEDDSECGCNSSDTETRRNAIARCRESRLLDELNKMNIPPRTRLALYFHHVLSIHNGTISRDGWVELAQQAGLNEQTGDEIAQLADHSTKIKARWENFAKHIPSRKRSESNPAGLGRLVNETLEEPINSDGERFDEVMHRIVRECDDNMP